MGVAMTYLYLSHPLMEDFPMEIYTILRSFLGVPPWLWNQGPALRHRTSSVASHEKMVISPSNSWRLQQMRFNMWMWVKMENLGDHKC